MDVADQIEPYPGVAPSPSHVAELIDLIRKRGINIIAVEPYFDHRVPDKIAAETGARVVRLYPSIGGRDRDESYVDFLRGNIDALVGAKP
jgi:zinc/manganese transport system substrate-binding protein